MKILILTQYFLPETGAAQLRLAAFARELKRRGVSVEIVTAMPNYPRGRIFPAYAGRLYVRETWEGCPVHRVWLYAASGAGVKRLANYLSFAVTGLWGALRASKADFVFVESPPLFLGLTGHAIARLTGAELVLNVSDLWPDSVVELGLMRDGPLIGLARRLERWLYARARYVTAVTEGIRTTFTAHKGLAPGKVLYLPNGVDLVTFREQPADAALVEALGLAGRDVILYAGTHGYAHGMEVALEAAALLRDAPIHFLFAGDGSEKPRLVARAAELGLTHVTFLEPCPPEQVARLYALSLAGLSTLRRSPLFEGTRPVKIFAAMAAGKPVLYVGEGEGARLVAGEQAGVVVPPEDPAALAQAILALQADPARAARLGRNGRRFVERHMSWAALTDAWLAQLQAAEVRLPEAS